MNKKGLSQIITTVIIILISIVAVMMIWALIKGIIDRSVNTTKLKERCGFIDLNFDMLATKCVPTTGLISYSITRGADSVSPMNMLIVIGNSNYSAEAPVLLTSYNSAVSGTYTDGQTIKIKVAPVVGLPGSAPTFTCGVTDEQTITCQS